MKLNPRTSNDAGTWIRPAMRAFGLLAIAALLMPCSSAAASTGGQLTEVGADPVLAKSTPAPSKKTRDGNCMDCHGQDLKDVVGAHPSDSGGGAISYGSNYADSGPNEIFMIAGGVSFSAVVGIVLLGFFGSREPVRSADQG